MVPEYQRHSGKNAPLVKAAAAGSTLRDSWYTYDKARTSPRKHNQRGVPKWVRRHVLVIWRSGLRAAVGGVDVCDSPRGRAGVKGCAPIGVCRLSVAAHANQIRDMNAERTSRSISSGGVRTCVAMRALLASEPRIEANSLTTAWVVAAAGAKLRRGDLRAASAGWALRYGVGGDASQGRCSVRGAVHNVRGACAGGAGLPEAKHVSHLKSSNHRVVVCGRIIRSRRQ